MGDPAASESPGVHNEISNGVQSGTVVQGRDIMLQLTRERRPAPSGPHANPAEFTGRGNVLREVLECLAPQAAASGAPNACSLAGMPGVGKTRLAAEAAHQAQQSGWFPGGVLYVDLHGDDAESRLTPRTALDGMLRDLGVPAERIPPHEQARERLYAAELAKSTRQGRRILVILDNAFSVEQIRPLLPTDRTTAVLITSRHTLSLVEARLVNLPVLSPEAAVQMLAGALRVAHGAKDTRIANDQAAAKEIARLCGYLPLALRIVGAQLAEDPLRGPTDLAHSLRNEHTRLDELTLGPTAVRAAFELSYRNLSHEDAALFSLLALHPGFDFATRSTTHLAGYEERKVRTTLRALHRAGLIERVPTTTQERWRMHDLVRLYVNDLAKQLPKDARAGACERILSGYLEEAEMNTSAFNHGTKAANRLSALNWYEAEYPSLVAAVTLAEERKQHEVGLRLAFALAPFFDWMRHHREKLIVMIKAQAAARALGNQEAEGRISNWLGQAHHGCGRFEEAFAAFEESLTIYRARQDRSREAAVLLAFSYGLADAGHNEDALDKCLRSFEIKLDLRDSWGIVAALSHASDLLADEEGCNLAMEGLRTARALLPQIDDRVAESRVLLALGMTMLKAGSPGEAVPVLRESLEASKEQAERHQELAVLGQLGKAFVLTSQDEEAVGAFRRSETLAHELGDEESASKARDALHAVLGRTAPNNGQSPA